MSDWNDNPFEEEESPSFGFGVDDDDDDDGILIQELIRFYESHHSVKDGRLEEEDDDNDDELFSKMFFRYLEALVEEGEITEQEIDAILTRYLILDDEEEEEKDLLNGEQTDFHSTSRRDHRVSEDSAFSSSWHGNNNKDPVGDSTQPLGGDTNTSTTLALPELLVTIVVGLVVMFVFHRKRVATKSNQATILQQLLAEEDKTNDFSKSADQKKKKKMLPRTAGGGKKKKTKNRRNSSSSINNNNGVGTTSPPAVTKSTLPANVEPLREPADPQSDASPSPPPAAAAAAAPDGDVVLLQEEQVLGEEERILQEVLKASLLDYQRQQENISPRRVVDFSSSNNDQHQQQQREQEQKTQQRQQEREAAKQRQREADEKRLRKQKQQQAHLANRAKGKKREAEQQKRQREEQQRIEQERREAEQRAALEKCHAQRRAFWKAQIDLEESRVERLVLLLAAEFCRKQQQQEDSNSPHRSALLRDARNKTRFTQQARQIYRNNAMFFGSDEQHLRCSRVVVKGSGDRWEGKSGMIQEWNASKRKFLVSLASNKTTKRCHLSPHHLEPQPNKTPPSSTRKEGRPKTVSVRLNVFHDDDDDDDDEEEENAVVEIAMETVDGLFAAEQVDCYLDTYTTRRNQEELQARLHAEKELAKQQRADRRAFWMKHSKFEKDVVRKLVQLLAAEFCRSVGQDSEFRSQLLKIKKVRETLEAQAKETFFELYGHTVPSRVIVKGSDQPELDGRIGTMMWNVSRGKFRVELDAKKKKTKKGKSGHDVYLLPDFLEALPIKPATKKQKNKKPGVSFVFIAPLYGTQSLMYEVDKETVDVMIRAKSLEKFLDAFVMQRDEEETQAKQAEEEKQFAEYEARRRRAEKLRREEEEWQRQKQAFRERTERLKEMHRERKRAQRERRDQQERDMHYEEMDNDDHVVEEEEDDDEEGYPSCHRDSASGSCRCPECLEREFARKLFEEFFSRASSRGMGGPSFFFRSGPSFFYVDDDDEYYFDDGFDDEDDWDDEFDRMHDQELAERNAEAAKLLEVEEDATEDEINRKFRRWSLLYHPDKYNPDRHEDGKTREEAEEMFKQLSDARDEMLLYRERISG